MKILAIGELLWDVFPDQEFLGGAALNFCANIRRLGGAATLVSGVGADERGARAIDGIHNLGLSSDCVQVVKDLATGTAVVSFGDGGEADYLIRRPAAFDRFDQEAAAVAVAKVGSFDWIYFGTLLQTEAVMEEFVARLVTDRPGTQCFYDLNLRTGHWTFDLVQRLSHRCQILKLNLEEAKTLSTLSGIPAPTFDLAEFCRKWSVGYDVHTICVTLGEDGCYIHGNQGAGRFDGFAIQVQDAVGAGDAFAAALVHCHHAGWPIAEIATFANAVGAIVASRAGATPVWTNEDCTAMIRQASH